MRVRIRHESLYRYPAPASLGPHTLRLRPAAHARARVETYALHVNREHLLHWQRDPLGNEIARVRFRPEDRVDDVAFTVELVADIEAVNPFDFVLEPRAERIPFAYGRALERDVAPFLRTDDPCLAAGPLYAAFARDLPREGATVDLLVALNQAVQRRVRYVIREEPGVRTPEETLAHGDGSCRDSALLLVRVLRERGLAARFVSGYLVQLRDDGMLPDEQRGMDRDVVDLHAWAEVFLPGAGWVGLDATSGLFCGEGHLPLVSTTSPEQAAPIEGTADARADEVRFTMEVERLGHVPDVVRPYAEDAWRAILGAARATDARLAEAGVTLTIGGEPTWTSRLYPALPEWNEGALGATKWAQGRRLADEVRAKLAPNGCILHTSGKHYPGEPLPRWALVVLGARDGAPLFPEREGLRAGATTADAERIARAIARELGVDVEPAPAYEDPWRFLQDEAALPLDVDPHAADLTDGGARARIARVLDRGVAAPVGWVLPLTRVDGVYRGDEWTFRRGRLYLVPGDGPLGLRLPLGSVEGALPPLPLPYDAFGDDDPRRDPSTRAEAVQRAWASLPASGSLRGLRSALCVEPRNGTLWVFLPPLPRGEDFVDLVRAVDRVRARERLVLALEGYPPSDRAGLLAVTVAPDPGVLEVNLPPVATGEAYAELQEGLSEAALRAGLTAEKYLVDGRLAGSGGGNHVTLGGPRVAESVFVRRPGVLASLLTFLQHHPSLSYAFSGLFVGPTSQAPRVDEGRHGALDELEIALRGAFDAEARGGAPPWLGDALLRDLLVDLTGNTHRAEVSVDKLFDFRTAYGRQGIVELRAFEMPPHPRMAAAQGILLRALVASFCREPYDRPLVRWGERLHDEMLLPWFLGRDLDDVLAHLARAGLPFPPGALAPFLELRCPLAGTLRAGDVVLEVRAALEPWHVLGEELTQGGTSRFVDSATERVEVRALGFVPGRHAVLVNGAALPMRATGDDAVAVAGVRFRAWAPPRSLHAHLGVHHPLRFEVVDLAAGRSLGACAYHVWHPEGRAFAEPPLTRFEAKARRAQRFTSASPSLAPAWAPPAHASEEPTRGPYTFDLRRRGMDRPPPAPFPRVTD